MKNTDKKNKILNNFKAPQNNVGVTKLEHLLVYFEHSKIFIEKCMPLVRATEQNQKKASE